MIFFIILKQIYFIMNILNFKRIAPLGLTAATFLNACGQKTEKPNILWITIEDTSPQFIGFCGNRHVKTPNLDRLAAEGVIFTNAFATGPVSSASRSCLITGVNNSQLGTGNHRSLYPLPQDIRGFPGYLRKAGYYTTNNLKTDYNTSNEKDIISFSWDQSNQNAGWWGREKGQKFFSVFNFMNSHQSRTMTTPRSWYEEKVLGKLDKDHITSPAEIDVPPIYRDTEEMRYNLSRVYNSINLTDTEIGLLVDSLERHGLKESTVIFFFADHGEGIPRGKASSIGLSYRVPFFIWFPSRYRNLSPWKPGTSTDELICFEDLPPTVLSLAGAEIPGYMTGRPFLGAARKKPVPYVFGSRNRIDESPDLVRTATDGRFFYTREFFQRYPEVLFQKYAEVSDILKSIRKDFKKGRLNKDQSLMLVRRDPEFLYDLKNDPWELNNLANEPAWSKKTAEMRKATYERALTNKDLNFLPEYEIQQISLQTTPYEYGKSEKHDAKKILDAAWEATNPSTKAERLKLMLQDSNKIVRYWAAVGIHNSVDNEKPGREILMNAIHDDYPPVAIESAAIALERYNSPEAKAVLEKFASDRNNLLSLQALQMIEYLDNIPADILDLVENVLGKRSSQKDGYENDYNVVSICEVILYRQKGRPLFIPEYRKWTNPEYLNIQGTN